MTNNLTLTLYPFALKFHHICVVIHEIGTFPFFIMYFLLKSQPRMTIVYERTTIYRILNYQDIKFSITFCRTLKNENTMVTKPNRTLAGWT